MTAISRLSVLSASQYDEAAQLVHASLSDWYARNLNKPGKFGGDWRGFLPLVLTYESLDPGCTVTAVNAQTGALEGVVFYHPRETHWAVGIVSTAVDAGGRGVARAMMEEVLRLAIAAGMPVRLVSSAMNLDSFSLYTRLGFSPHTFYQDMMIPPERLPQEAPWIDGQVRPAVLADSAAMAELEYSLSGIRREKDWRYILANAGDVWHTVVSEDHTGRMTGFLCRGGMIGPGAAVDESVALALLHAQLRSCPEKSPVVLVPVRALQMVQTLYQWGARNVEMHAASCLGHCPPARGVTFPCFLPESG